ncbi:MAG: universal stress protein [Nitrospirae bacterium CG_4_10_14_0_8_um_filter_41_23]|nr:universal stress protein [Nitrospirota bacterium]PIV41422.1 MAG: universal stress protein [Nitrospirae bacterium CG02_land_8_20_14_3_00_41_53]PIW87657.1 MAG: universal stress protein [Nitrospirae bacterium CG_4_8_14_3_um_filter_41_47]PIY87644.1 MAG: universal stress protein [Nitrospirae bacterium CG_4_10_14_0_8_um_filter_41_23]PJA80790.1 MAG: universal stress protein [Nitrospirae bacterium CG_4_9_14_3_um_filter_41_27]
MSAYQVCPTAKLEKLLLSTDGSEFSEGAVRESINLAKTCGSKLYTVSVIEVNPEFVALAPQVVKKFEKETRVHLESIKTRASNEGVDCEIIAHEGEEPFQYIVDEAAKNNVEMIIMGRRGRIGLKRLMMGSVTARVIGYAPCKVLVVPKAAKVTYKNILVATDGSKYSEAASREAISIAKRTGSDLIVLSVATKDENLPAAKRSVNEVKKIAEKEGIRIEVLTTKGMPYEVIVKTAKEKDAGVIVVGSYGRTGIKRLLMGSVTARVIGHAECPVLVVKS